MSPSWIDDAVFYHIYPLGLCDAPAQNNTNLAPIPRLEKLHGWLDHIQSLGVNALYLGPLFESSAHGYDTINYTQVDRRLGDHQTLQNFLRNVKSRGIRVVVDAVFNHVGRDFPAFQAVLRGGLESPYARWFSNLNGSQSSPYGDAFSYEGWAGHYDLVKLKLHEPEVRQHLFDAVTFWVKEFDIDGLRLDAADHLDADFMRALAEHTRQLKPAFWLMGEVVHGDYRQWANTDMLHATTNYEVYKGLYSSHVDCNYFEIAYSLNRLFGEDGIYRHLQLYNFADNHDVNRVASNLTKPAHLYTLYGLLFTIPGVPSIYYGSEWGIEGQRTHSSDRELRPALDLEVLSLSAPHPDLVECIRRFAALRHGSPALRVGDYRQLYVAHEQFAFRRALDGESMIVAVNASDQPATIHFSGCAGARLFDQLNPGEVFSVENGATTLTIPPNWLRILADCA